MGKYVNWEGVKKDLKQTFSSKKTLAKIAIHALLTGALCGGVQMLGNVVRNYEFVPRDRVVKTERIDGDNLQDLVVGNHIYLANQVEDEVNYRLLTDSDRYRVQM